jgi:ribosomal protein S18 acetylase RimI-like enzyme
MIVYTEALDGVTADMLRGGFFVGWPDPPSAETHLRLLRQSDHIILAADDETGSIVGFVTAISDGVLCAYIPLLEVLPMYQRRGIGTELMRHMFTRLRGLYAVDLLCDPEVQPFYARLGMRPATGMIVRNL